ncbi:hypothetical protein [Roseibacillus persicicus]|uniref:hypothetical protein n=1 Tax=Roseibacillus persicicus TaxID=454148 RepID=UPI002811FD95|nr:hypothetical protein [Roseibacillus persicicus]
MEYERPSLAQIQGARIERLALSLAGGRVTEGRIRTTITTEVKDTDEQKEVLRLVIERASVLVREQKRRYLILGTIWTLVGAVPLIVGLIFTRGSLLVLTAGPIAYGVYLVTRKGNDPKEFDEIG